MRLPRRRWLVAACVPIAVLALAGWWLWPEPAGVPFTRGQYERIARGMTLAEVEAVVGVPSGVYGPRHPSLPDFVYSPCPEGRTPKTGVGPLPDTSIRFWVFADGSVLEILFVAAEGEWTVFETAWTGCWEIVAHQWLAWLRGLIGL